MAVRCAIVWLLMGAAVAGTSPSIGRAADLELVMFEAPGCHWCAQWREEIGPIYPKTPESKRAPLRRVNLHGSWPEWLRGIRAVSFTPTFVLMEGETEVGRITGYAGEDFFWAQLDLLLRDLPADPDDADDAASPSAE